jgi:two-component system chemotaxis response regulator CheY
MAYKEIVMILIADDDIDLAENCSMMLESHGYDVVLASNGREALEKICVQKPDLLISDCVMPEMGGLQLSEEIKAMPVEDQFPVLLMSASLKCKVASGTSYDGFLHKPFLAEDFLREVRKLIPNYASDLNKTKGNA